MQNLAKNWDLPKTLKDLIESRVSAHSADNILLSNDNLLTHFYNNVEDVTREKILECFEQIPQMDYNTEVSVIIPFRMPSDTYMVLRTVEFFARQKFSRNYEIILLANSKKSVNSDYVSKQVIAMSAFLESRFNNIFMAHIYLDEPHVDIGILRNIGTGLVAERYFYRNNLFDRHIVVSSDSDIASLGRTFLQALATPVISGKVFSTGKLDWAIKSNTVSYGTRFFVRLFQNILSLQYFETGHYPTSGNNTCFDLAAFLHVGGYIEGGDYSEDTFLGASLQFAFRSGFEYVRRKEGEVLLPARRIHESIHKKRVPFFRNTMTQNLNLALISDWPNRRSRLKSKSEIIAFFQNGWPVEGVDVDSLVKGAVAFTDREAYSIFFGASQIFASNNITVKSKDRCIVRILENGPRNRSDLSVVIDDLLDSKIPSLFVKDFSFSHGSREKRYMAQEVIMNNVLKKINMGSIFPEIAGSVELFSFEVDGLSEKSMQRMHCDDIRVLAGSVIYEQVSGVEGGAPILFDANSFLDMHYYDPNDSVFSFEVSKEGGFTSGNFTFQKDEILRDTKIFLTSNFFECKPFLFFLNSPFNGVMHGATSVFAESSSSVRLLRYSGLAIRP